MKGKIELLFSMKNVKYWSTKIFSKKRKISKKQLLEKKEIVKFRSYGALIFYFCKLRTKQNRNLLEMRTFHSTYIHPYMHTDIH